MISFKFFRNKQYTSLNYVSTEHILPIVLQAGYPMLPGCVLTCSEQYI